MIKAETKDTLLPYRILVVEDEVTVGKLLARILALPRFDVIHSTSTKEARQNLTPPPSLIILDLGLLGESSEEFCHSVHRDPLTRHVPILILTGHDVPDLVDSSLATCAQELLRKPFDPAALVFHVETLLKMAAYNLRHFPDAFSSSDKA
jgi:DNA-binding response OmpR family regulator